jgi:Tfp pilus assembly protein PilN
MKIKWIDNILQSPAVAGVELIFLQEGAYRLNYQVLKNKKNTVEPAQAGEGIASLEDLQKIIGNIPVLLTVNGKGIINKKISITEQDTDKTILGKILPNANPLDFYLQYTLPFDKIQIASVIRKNQLDEVIQEIGRLKMDLVSCTIGPFIVSAIAPLMEHYSSGSFKMKGQNYELELSDGLIADYKPVESEETVLTEILIAENKVNDKVLIAFAAAMSYYTGQNNILNTIPAVNDMAGEYRQKRLFMVSGWSVLAFFLLTLLCNFFFYNNYSELQNRLSAKVYQNRDQLENYEKLNTDFTTKKAFLEKAGLLSVSRTSFYTDQLALDLPASILLTGLNVNPFEKKTNNMEEEISFLQNQVKVTGICKKSLELNEWIKLIQKKSWVKEVVLVNYTSEKSSTIGDFIINVKIK